MLKAFQLSFRFLKSQKFASLSRKTGSNIFVFQSGRSFFLDFFFIFDFSGALPYSDTSQVKKQLSKKQHKNEKNEARVAATGCPCFVLREHFKNNKCANQF